MSGTLYQELVKAFGKEATEEIVARVICGESLDSAMQTVMDKEDLQ